MAERAGWQLRAYLAASRAIPLAAPAILRRRLARGREDPDRWREKLGEAGAARPEGTLVWCHAVGLGEVMALRGLIGAMGEARPDWSFLVTSTARSSARVIGANLPPRTRHRFLPLDAPRYVARFLDHWRPSLSVWAEQDLWPGAVVATAARGIPLALVNARMNDAAFARRRRAGGLYRDLLARFAVIEAQDEASAAHLRALSGRAVAVAPGLKAGNAPLGVDEGALARMRAALDGRTVRVAASTHAEDEAVVLRHAGQGPLLVVVPRVPERGAEVVGAARAMGLRVTLGSDGALPGAEDDVVVDDAFGRLGMWYRLADLALVGGSFGAVEGHNPWEAAALGCAVLHGPRVANFAADYARMDGAEAARAVTAETLGAALADGPGDMGARGLALARAARADIVALAGRLVALAEAGE